MLLTAPTPLAQDFRRTFSARILKPKFDIEIGADSVRVESQLAVHPPGGVSQIIDLVMSLDNAVTEVMPDRLALKAEMERAVVLFNRRLQEADGPLHGCVWKPTPWRSPRNDVYFGPLIAPDGKPRKGQSLVLKALFQEAGESVPLGKYRVRVAFRLERKGGDKTYRPELPAD